MNSSVKSGAGRYRYGFNGKENDNEVKGVGDQIDYGMRVYDPRIGKFLSVDPLEKKYPELSTYQFSSNSPISAIDIDGMEGSFLSDFKAQQARKAAEITTKLNNRGVLPPPPHPQPTISATNPTEIAMARQESTRREVLNRMYNSDASFSIQIFTGVGAAANIEFPDAGVALHTYESLKDGNIFEALEGAGTLSMLQSLRVSASFSGYTNKPASTATIYRTQGGELPNASRERIHIGEKGSVSIEGDDMLYVTINDKNHQVYFYEKRGGSDKGAYIASFKLPQSLVDEIRNNAVPQQLGKSFPDKPQISDPTKSTGAYGLPKNYIEKLKQQAIQGSGKTETPNNK